MLSVIWRAAMWEFSAVPHDTVGLILIKTQAGRNSEGSCRTASQPREISPFNLTSDRVRRRCGVLSLVAQEGVEIARSGETDAENQGIFRRINEVVLEGGVEARFEADLRGIGLAGKGRSGAFGEGPVGGWDKRGFGGLGRAALQGSFGAIEGDGTLVVEREVIARC